MKYLTVPSIGVGTDADPIRPDIPTGTSFVGNYDSSSGTYFIAVPDNVTVGVKAGRIALNTAKAKDDALTSRRLSNADVALWTVT